MPERFGLLFADGSIYVLGDEADIEEAQREADQHDEGEPVPRTRVVRLRIEIRPLAAAGDRTGAARLN